MSWITLKNSSGYKIEVEYNISNNQPENYSLVTCTRIRLSSTSAYHSVYNNYPPSNSLSAILGFGVNTTRKTQRVTLGTISPNSSKTYDLTDLSVKVYHNSSTGKASCSICGFVDTQTNSCNLNWGAKSITLSTFDRKAASISISYINRTNTSLSFSLYTNKNLSNSYYKINNGSWIGVGSISGGKSRNITINNLSPNTNYTIYFYGKTSINNLNSNTVSYNKTTDADASTIQNVNFNNIYTNSIIATISSNTAQNNPVSYYLYSLTNSNFIISYNSQIQINNLKSNTAYTLYVKAISTNGKESSVYQKNFVTDTVYPNITSVLITPNDFSINCEIKKYNAEAGLLNFKYYINGSLKGTTKSNIFTFTDLDSYTDYNIQIVIIDNKNRESSINKSIKTKAYLSNDYNVDITEISYNQVKISVNNVKNQVPITGYKFYFNNNEIYYSSVTNSYIQTNLKPYTNYNLTVEVIDSQNNIAKKSNILFKTLQVPPIIKSVNIFDITPFKANIVIDYEEKEGTIITDYLYSINDNEYNNSISNSILLDNLTPNTSYNLKIKIKDSNSQYSEVFQISFKTKEDKWIQVSINGSSFKKMNLYIITVDGKNKIEKSNRKIMRRD